MAKRLSKEHIETDPLLTSYYIFTSFLKRNLTSVLAGTLAALILIGGGIYYYLHTQAQEQQSQELLVEAEQVFHMGEYELALQGGDMQLEVGLVDIIENYGSTSAGNLARYYAAVAESELGNYNQALHYIQEFDPPDGILGVGPLALQAVILANLEQYEESANAFLNAAEWDENESTTPQNLLNAAQVSIEAENYDEAAEHIDRILSEYEDSDVADQARRLEGMLLARR